MSLQDVRVKLETGLDDIYTALEEKSATIPEQKNLVNVAPAIRSITGGGGANQVVNYTMLYDGSLGSADNGNICSEVTGGYDLNTSTSTGYALGTAEKLSNSIRLYAKRTSTSATARFVTTNKINIEGFSKFTIITKANLSGANNYTWLGARLSDVYGANETPTERYYLLTEADISNDSSLNNVKLIRTISLENTIEKNLYFNTYISSTNSSHSAEFNLYEAFMLKQDNYQELLNLAGITTTYTDEASICADSTAITTILSNEEAVNYMLLNCTGTFMLAFIQSSVALTALVTSPYIKNVYLNAHWQKFLNFIK